MKGGNLLSYDQNNFENDPQNMQLATRQMFSEQTQANPMQGGKSMRKKQKKDTKKRRKSIKKGGTHIGTAGYFNNFLGDGGFNTSSMQNDYKMNNVV